MYLIHPKCKQYKANLHCHTKLSDGKMTPRQIKRMYKKAGYSILSITDHETPGNHSYLNDKNFITITGYEAYIRNCDRNQSNPYNKEIHMNLFAKDPENTGIVCFNPGYCKYLSDGQKAALVKYGSQAPREYSVEYINNFIKTATENGFLVTYNHPWWSMEDEADILSYDGYFSLEISNYSSDLLSSLEYSGALYDKMLIRGKRVYCHSADDNHNRYPEGDALCDSFGGFTMIMPEEFTYEGIIKAMESGEMYSSMGPTFKEVSMEGNRIHIVCSDVSRIMVFTGSKYPKRLIAQPGCTVNTADFEIDDRANYIRVSIVDDKGRYADTRGFFRDELEF